MHAASGPRAAHRDGLLLTAVACVVLTFSCAESVRTCTTIGCAQPFQVSFSPEKAWPAGTYAIAVTEDGVTTRCTATLPLSCQRQVTCDRTPEWTLIQSGCALPAGEHALGGVFFQSSPASVRVTVSRDGRELGSGEFMPTYTTSRPNGDGCEPVCRSAPSAEMSVNFAPRGA